MQNFRQAFLEFAVQQSVLKFGEFTLKSGRVSPYFFNAGFFNTGQGVGKLGRFYAQAIAELELDFDVLYGPAYKGIPLAVSTAIALAEQHGKNVPYAFNRKTPKDHGEGGTIVGGPLTGRVLIIDDVITAGTAIGSALEIIRASGGEPAGVLISLDRCEKGTGERSAVEEVEAEHGIPVRAIATLDDLLKYMKGHEDWERYLPAMQRYRAEYGTQRT